MRREAPKRQQFLGGLLNEDLQELSKWHGNRPPHEQRRFLKSVDMLYKEFTKMETSPAKGALNSGLARASPPQPRGVPSPEDPFERPTTPTQFQANMVASASAPSLSRPIEVFEHRKRQGLRKRTVSGDPRDNNSLQQWLEAQSLASQGTSMTSGTAHTGLTSITRTSSGMSLCSMPGTTNQATFRFHNRAVHMNQPKFKRPDAHEATGLKDGVPGVSFPEKERLKTQFMEQFGTSPLGQTISQEMYSNVFHADHHDSVNKFLDGANSEQRDQFGNMVRSLQFLRRSKNAMTMSKAAEDLDLFENSRLWQPSRARPSMEKEACNRSFVPLGTLNAALMKKKAAANKLAGDGVVAGTRCAAVPPIATWGPPPSPPVSGLCSMALTPRSLPTPLIAGVDMPLASAPEGARQKQSSFVSFE